MAAQYIQYECIKAFTGIGAKPGDIIEIEKLPNGEYMIAGACQTGADVVYEFFEKKRLKGWRYSPYSHSKMETWKQCQKKFEYNYIIRPPKEEIPNPILEKGTLFHSVLEHDVTNNIENFSLRDVFKALTVTDAEEIIDNALIFAQTSTMYNKIKRTKGIKVSEQELFLDRDLNPTKNESEALIRGFIDLIIFDKENSKCFVYDWKTGGGSKDKLMKWPKPYDQLELYAIWAVELFDVDFVETGFVYVEQDHLAKHIFKREDIPSLKKKFKEKIDQIEKDTSFKKNLTRLCGWCDYRELCLGIDIKRDPYTITLELIKACA